MATAIVEDEIAHPSQLPRRILVLGGTGTIGRATVRALVACGYETICFVRPGATPDVDPNLPPNTAKEKNGTSTSSARTEGGQNPTLRHGKITDPAALATAIARERFDAIISCLASRTGTPADAWAIDHAAHSNALAAAKAAGIPHFIQLSAICVQKPLLAFQHAKLAFEAELIASGLRYSIVRPTAFFKSLSGQVERVRAGKPYLLFGDGSLTACKPISDDDLAAYLVDCLDDPGRWNRILPIGGPGPAQTPRQQGEALFALLGRPPRFRQVPVKLLDTIIAVLSALGRIAPPLAAKAELARIGRYYATESMLVLDPQTGRYDADATPSTGTQTLADYHAQLLAGQAQAERGDHAVF
ncbi:NAD(P)H-binding protein [Sphingomonas qomolangmaensis]|uniref:Divinyl chlorophyllide a 8-vinyl-reductase, chloroplastic n=1 Tax=Sphingomonas qomolangmaensis TaxID=2918765 RepID=A0ABY5LD35_9SPHN|nr:NAD(P)H-binding protein [Sphingomonas qomolangmaensis]UUL83933.1 NAD(P)H-binding protein [Sphingomonas qomolangmaensis]